MFLHCKNCGRKSYLKSGYKYGYCVNNPVCKSLFLKTIQATPENKEYRKQYFSTNRGKQVNKEAKRRYRGSEKGRQARRRERLKHREKIEAR